MISEEPSMEEIIEKMAQSLNISNKEVRDTPPQYFVAYHVYVMEEKEAVKESQSNEYEMQLYQDYMEREGVQQGFSRTVSTMGYITSMTIKEG